MKIAWITPFSVRSAIGRFSALVTAELQARGHEVTIIRCEADTGDPTPRHATELPVFYWTDWDPKHIEVLFDVVVFNLGDNYGFHGGVIPLIDRVLGIGIFHDFFIYHLFSGWYYQEKIADEVRDREIAYAYDAATAAQADAIFARANDLEFIAARLPMTEWIAKRCGAAIAHSNFYRARLEQACPGPVGMTHLAFQPRNVPSLEPRPNQAEVSIITSGWMNPNKCADRVIEAIGGSPFLRGQCRYRLVGPITDGERRRLKQIADHAGVKIDVLGEVDDDTLDQELARADIVCCLRKPVIEGASATAIEAMMSGRPVIVADSGFYADLPNDVVAKVDADVSIASLRAALERLVKDEPLRRSMGDASRSWSLEQFSVGHYAQGFEDLAKRYLAQRPYLKLGRSIGEELAALELPPDDPSVPRLASALNGLLSATRR